MGLIMVKGVETAEKSLGSISYRWGYQTFNGNACSQSVWFVLQLKEDRKKRREWNADSRN